MIVYVVNSNNKYIKTPKNIIFTPFPEKKNFIR